MVVFNNTLINNILNNNTLSITIWLPIIFGIAGLLLNNKYWTKLIFIVNLINFIISLLLLKKFNVAFRGWQFSEYYTLVPDWGVCYSLGIDGFSILLLSLSCLIIWLILTANVYQSKFDYKYEAYFSIMSGLINGVLASRNSVLFYVFFESMLIPLYLIIGIWGGTNRIYAATKFFIYTIAGSLLFLIAIVFLYNIAINSGVAPINALEIENFYLLKLTLEQQIYLFLGFFIAFAIKIPMVPLHTWLPDAHYEAPTGGSVILAAITLKLGAFAMLRFLLPITIGACYLFSKYVIPASLVAIIYIGFITFIQKDFKKLIAYSSIASMGFVTMGMFMVFPLLASKVTDLAILSLNGALIQMLSHGLIASGLFFCVGMLFDRSKTHTIKNFSGLASVMPLFASLFMLLCLSNVAIPGTFGFIGELLIILASFKYSVLLASLAASSLILSLGYTFLVYKNVIFGVPNSYVNFFIDLNFKEIFILTIIGSLILIFGIYPQPIIEILNNFSINLINILGTK